MIKPYYETENGKLYHGDCLDIMREMDDNSVDLVLTDPPYGLGSTNFVTARRKKRPDKKWNNKIPEREYFEQIYRVSINQIIWGCNYFGEYIKNVGRIVHYKEMTSHNGPLKLSDCDLASQSYDRRIHYYHYQWSGNVQGGTINWKNIGPDARVHPTQKPISLMVWSLLKFTKESDIICDCYFGSGTIAVACERLNRRWIGIEISKEYCDIAVERIKREVAQLKLELT